MQYRHTAARAFLYAAGLCLLAAAWARGAEETVAGQMLARYDRFPHAEAIEHESRRVLDHVVGLGPMQKVRGDWRLESSERLTGMLTRYTWRIVDGFSSASLLEQAAADMAALPGSVLLYACEARACGRSVQWANRVFGQRVLYGTESSQLYRVYALSSTLGEQRLVMYAAARTSDRQYLHMELLTVAPDSEG